MTPEFALRPYPPQRRRVMLTGMSTTTDKRTRLNVAVDDALHRELRLLSVELGKPLTVLVPMLLRLGAEAKRQELAKGKG
jgi:hypothetical protein